MTDTIEAREARLRELDRDPVLGLDLVGRAVECAVCRRQKQPVGRSAPLGAYLCDNECKGYRAEPFAGELWPGERREDFGFGEYAMAVAALRNDALAIIEHYKAEVARLTAERDAAVFARDSKADAEMYLAGHVVELQTAHAALVKVVGEVAESLAGPDAPFMTALRMATASGRLRAAIAPAGTKEGT